MGTERPGTDALRLARQGGVLDYDSLAVTIDALPLGLLVVDESGRIVLTNTAAGEIFGWPPGRLVDRSVENLIPEDVRANHRRYRSDYAQSPSVRRMGAGRFLRCLRSDGSTLTAEVALSPIVVGGIPHVVTTVRDITEQVDAEQVARREESWRAVLDDRMRIARDLHDSVIQDLFATGLTVANLLSISEESMTGALERVISQLDTSIRRLREAVFQLHANFPPDDGFQWVVRDATRVLGFEPRLIVRGDLRLVTPDLLVDVEVVLRECLSNVARHARATETSITIEQDVDEVIVTVADNGVGMESGAAPAIGTGFRSLDERARQRGGRTSVESSPADGTNVVWRVPLRPK